MKNYAYNSMNFDSLSAEHDKHDIRLIKYEHWELRSIAFTLSKSNTTVQNLARVTSPLSLRREDSFITLDLNEIFSILTQNFAFLPWKSSCIWHTLSFISSIVISPLSLQRDSFITCVRGHCKHGRDESFFAMAVGFINFYLQIFNMYIFFMKVTELVSHLLESFWEVSEWA